MLITKGTGGLRVRGEVPPGKKGSARLILTVYSCRCSRTGLSGSQGRSSSCQHGREHFGLCWQCNAPAGEKWHFVQLVLKKKKKERENASLLCKGLRLHRTIRSQILSCSTSVCLFMNLSLTLFLTGRTRTVFFFPAWVKKKKRELWFFANSWRETICFNGAGSVIFTLTKGRFSALRDPRNRSCCCSSDVLMGFTGLWHWGHSLNHPVPSRCLP